jgi:hypothetical protein
MGINFVKQFVAAGLSRDTQLFAPGFSADEDVIKAVGAPMMGMFNSSHWAHDMDNPENKRFVAEFEKEYKRLPSLYASQGYDAAFMMDAAVRDVKGKVEDKAALQKALEAKRFKSVRGDFRFNTNHYPVQNYYQQDHGHHLHQSCGCLCRPVQDEVGRTLADTSLAAAGVTLPYRRTVCGAADFAASSRLCLETSGFSTALHS